jgi:hypothetical protein
MAVVDKPSPASAQQAPRSASAAAPVLGAFQARAPTATGARAGVAPGARSGMSMECPLVEDVVEEQWVDGLGRFTAYADGQVKAFFADRCGPLGGGPLGGELHQ